MNRAAASRGDHRRETIAYFTRALRTEPLAYQGKLLGHDVLPS